jgi:hypothetical protein
VDSARGPRRAGRRARRVQRFGPSYAEPDRLPGRDRHPRP